MRGATTTNMKTTEMKRTDMNHDEFQPRQHHGRPGREDRGHRGARRRGRRAPRGDVRAAVLQLLGEAPMHGYQLMQRIAERSEGAWRPSPGAIYPVLAQLDDEGLIEVTRDEGRKLATLTDQGRAYVAAHIEELGDPFAALRQESGTRVDLREPVEELASAARQLARSGSSSQQEAARVVLRAARRSLYLILADVDLDADADVDVADPRAGTGE
jgi:DNA-binding PadR family transcriptional regulator